MSRNSRLTVVVPEFLDETGDHLRVERSTALLARLAGRGLLERRWRAASAEAARLMPWQRGLLAAMGLHDADHASAPSTALGAQLPEQRAWFHAEPIHLEAGLNDVALVRLCGAHALTNEERIALVPVLNAHIESMGLGLFTIDSGEWLIGVHHPLDVRSVNPDFAGTHAWNVALPDGKDAGMVRRLMTELQMLLHEHPVNEARVSRGLPTANAIWLWGCGDVGRSQGGARVACVGTHDYLRGVCRAKGWDAPNSQSELERTLADRTARNIVAVTESGAYFHSDQLQPIVAALESGRIDQLEFVLDEWQLSIDRWSLKKFWRRPLPIEMWSRA